MTVRKLNEFLAQIEPICGDYEVDLEVSYPSTGDFQDFGSSYVKSPTEDVDISMTSKRVVLKGHDAS